MFGIKQTLDTK
jgi:hypothetical protein